MQEKKTRKVLTVIVSYNAYHGGFFPRCLEHIRSVETENDGYKLDHQVLVVDSHSGDQTPEKVRREFEAIEVHAADENLGYAGGNNVGIKEAFRRQADYVAVVTQDVYAEPDWLLTAVAAAEKEDRVGAVQPLLCLWPDQEKVNSTGNHIHFLGYGYAGDYGMPADQVSSEPKEIAYASGAICLFSARALQDVGGFDERFWMYNEDQDIGWRLWLRGYKNVMAPSSVAYHQYEFSRSISKIYYMDRNRLMVMLQNYHWATLLLLSPFILANELAGFLLSICGGWKKEKLLVWKYFLSARNCREILTMRKTRQAHRLAPDKSIVKRFTGRILFQEVETPFIRWVVNPVLGTIWPAARFVIFW